MSLNILKDYISRRQMADYLEYVLQAGTAEVVDQGDGVHSSEPVSIRLGSTITSVKDFHVMRLNPDANLRLYSANLISENTRPALPDGCTYVGIFYLLKGAPSDLLKLGSDALMPVGGDVLWMKAEDYDSLVLGDQGIENFGRLVVFWGER